MHTADLLCPDPSAIAAALGARAEGWGYRVGPKDADADDAVFDLPRGSDHVVISVTGQRGEVSHWLVFTARQLPARRGRPGRSLTVAEALVELTTWLAYRHEGEVDSSDGWRALAVASTPSAQRAG